MSVIADAYLAGVSTRRVEKLVQQLGVERMSKSQVSRLAKSLDAIVEDFRTRPLDGGALRVRDARRAGGQVPRGRPHRQRLRRARGRRQPGRLPRVARPRRRHRRGRRRLARLPARPGRPRPRRREAGQLGRAPRPRRRDRGHAARRVPGSAAARTSCATCSPGCRRAPSASSRRWCARSSPSPTPTTVREQHAPDRRPARAAASPKRRRCSTRPAPTCSPSPASRRSTGGSSGATTRSSGSNKEIRRRTDVVGIFPDRPSIVRLVGAVLAEQNDEWAVARRYMSAESIAKALTDPIDEPEEVIAIAAAA